jgi:hypothetical protein
MSILTARVRLRPEVTSPVGGGTMVSNSCFIEIFRFIFYRLEIIGVFPLSENGGMMISAARSVLDRKMTSPFNPSTPIQFSRLWNFSSISHRSKIIRLS